jgi:DNA primase
MLPPDFKNIILDRVNIVDLIGQEISIKKSGTTYSCLCPFHSDKNPSMHIWEDSQRYKCFSCGAGGDVITFTIEFYKLSFLEALKELANKYSIPIPEGRGGIEKSFQNDIFRVNAMAMSLYSNCFRHAQNAGYEYMHGRGFTDEILNEFNVGFSLSGDSAFNSFCKTENKEVLVLAGLIKEKETGVLPTFYNRVMFPIEDERGRVLGFGGRTLNPNDKAFKYLNTSETEVFHKRKLLFGIKQAVEEIKKKKLVIITEGYTDVMMMHQHGYKNAVAVLGTALTADHLRLVKRFCKEAVLLLDGDEAGRNAMMRSMETFLSEDFLVSIALLPNGQDPFDALQSDKGLHFQESLDARIGVTEFLLMELRKKYNLASIEGKMDAYAELVKLFGVIQNPIKLSSLISEFSEKLGVDEIAFRKNFESLQEKKHKLNKIRNSNIIAPLPENIDFMAEKYGAGIERLMLMLALKEENLLNDLIGLGVADYLIDENIKKIFNVLIASEPGCNLDELFKLELTEYEHHLVNHLRYSSVNIKSISLNAEFERLKSYKREKQKNKVLEEIIRAEKSNNKEKKTELLIELASLK